MAAAYAALTSVMNIIHQLQHHPTPPISIDEQQLESLSKNVTLLQEFLESSYQSPLADGDEADPLEMRIAEAAREAEDVIESNIVDMIELRRSTTYAGLGLHKAITDLDCIRTEIKREKTKRKSKLNMTFSHFNCFCANALQKATTDLDCSRTEIKREKTTTSIVSTSAVPSISEAYVAVVSLINLIHLIEDDPLATISFDKQQIDSFTEIVTFFQEFLLQVYDSPAEEEDPLEIRIKFAAYAAEGVIRAHIKDVRELGRCTNSPYQSEGLHKVIIKMNLINKEIEKEKTYDSVEAQLHRNVPASAVSSISSIMVGFKEEFLEILDKLTAGESHRQFIPIVGMGGIGKTTLARHVYEHPFIKDHFDICVWVTISQQYNTKEILSELLCQANKKSREELSNMSEHELGLALHQYLTCRRFLIVLDDMWSIEAWEKMQSCFPDNGNGSRIVVTTRLSTLGSQLDKYYCLKMKFLDESSSWELFRKTVFGEESCPIQLKEIGKKIVETCRGLPLSIVVMGGLLKSIEHTEECWQSIKENSSSVGNSKNEDFCLRILKMSYNHLPVYLKPCFLYMGVFEEDCVVRVSTLVKLWVSEGFLKPKGDKSLEMAAKEYLNDLVDRNLIIVHELGCTGNIKYCKLHDLLRDLCRREAGKEGVYNVIGQHMFQSLTSQKKKFQNLNRERRCVISRNTSKGKVADALRYTSVLRSVICDIEEVLDMPNSRLLRVLNAYDRDTSESHVHLLENLFEFVNLRHLVVGVDWESKFPSSASLLWNLQTLIVFHSKEVTAPIEIWNMSQLRHVEFYKGVLYLPKLPSGNLVIMENLQTLKGVDNLNFDEVHKVFPDIKKLGVLRDIPSNLVCLSKLESFHCGSKGVDIFSFPYSLKKLSLESFWHWKLNEEMLHMLGSLPLLQKLKLERAQFQRCELQQWETSEDQFCSLKYLELKWCRLETWITESSHFPRLEQLRLRGLKELEEIPSEIGEVPTLRSIHLKHCSESSVVSAKKIALEQEELRVRIVLSNNEQALRSLQSLNFVVEIEDFWS